MDKQNYYNVTCDGLPSVRIRADHEHKAISAACQSWGVPFGQYANKCRAVAEVAERAYKCRAGCGSPVRVSGDTCDQCRRSRADRDGRMKYDKRAGMKR